MLQKIKSKFETTSFSLHCMAMFFMLLDHLWVSIVPGNDWTTCLGRLALPIFAFLIVEGYFHTKNIKKYVLRLLLCAILSEIPFNLISGGRVFFPVHQNTLWAFLIALGLLHWNEHEKKSPIFLRLFIAAASVCFGFILGVLINVDYTFGAVFTVLIFYFFRGRNLLCRLAQLICLSYVHFKMLGGLSYEIALFGQTYFVARQGLAVLALIPIWLYRGKQGYHSKTLQLAFYAFYPAHMLILALLKFLCA